LFSAAAAAAAVFAFGGASGAHLNPAVSLMLLLRGKISSGKALAYMVAQVGAQLYRPGLLSLHVLLTH
jgi:glycerol uptake facilitator-like aquaporin